MFSINIGDYIEQGINWLTENFKPFFDGISAALSALINLLQQVLMTLPSWVVILILALLSWYVVNRGVALFTLLGLLLIDGMGLWDDTMLTLALVLASGLIALLIGIPIGIWAARNDIAEKVIRPILDFMQTMPAFVYLIPAVLFFRLGDVPGVVATVIFSMPPAVRLTNLGIREVDKEVVEAARSFGATSRQLLLKVQLPLATNSILAGINQTIMLALSMVVIAAMIGAEGLGAQVLKGITQLKIGLGFESGIAVVILAIVLDRITQGIAGNK
jgi:glycine betaine/proline transport system permease protein